MPAKQVDMPAIGPVRLYKRRGARAIKISISGDYVRVTLPTWLPYRAGLEFVRSKSDWIAAHKPPRTYLSDGQQVGKAHRLKFIQSDLSRAVSTRVTDTEIRVQHHHNVATNHDDVQSAARNACLKALRREADSLLPQRLAQLAGKHGFSYQSVRVRQLKSRWGSCSQQKRISLNIFLMQLPWRQIDYVLLHELTHTKHLHHGKPFWQHLESCLPDTKLIRRELKSFQPVI